MADLEALLKDIDDLENPGIPVGMLVLYICLGVFIALPCFMVCVLMTYINIQSSTVRQIPADTKDKRCVVNCLCGES